MTTATRAADRQRHARTCGGVLGWTLAMLFTASGCGAGPSAPPPPAAPPVDCTADRPKWVRSPPGASAEALFAVGSGASRGGEGHARRKADFDAREALARQLRAEVSTLVRRIGKELELEAKQGTFEAVETFAGQQYAKQSLIASAAVQYHVDGCGERRAWVLMRVPIAGLDEAIWSATAAGFGEVYAKNAALLEKANALFDDAEKRAELQSGLRDAEESP